MRFEIEALAGRHGGGVAIERLRDDFTPLRNCAVSVGQAGYNTTMEILEAGAGAVLVPFAGGAERSAVLAQWIAEHSR